MRPTFNAGVVARWQMPSDFGGNQVARVASFLRSQAGRRLAGVLAAGALLLVPVPASAAEVVTRGTITTQTVDNGRTDDCRPGITGTLVATDVLSFQQVDQPVPGWHFIATETATGRLTWSDGTYSIIESVDHISFSTGAPRTSQSPTRISLTPIQLTACSCFGSPSMTFSISRGLRMAWCRSASRGAISTPSEHAENQG